MQKKKIINVRLTSENQNQKMKTLYKTFLTALATFGLLLGCGGDKHTKETSASTAKNGDSDKQEDDSSGKQEDGSSGKQEDDSSGKQEGDSSATQEGDSSVAQGDGEKAADLAKFLSGKRLYVDMGSRQAVLQFEKDGKFDVGVDIGGKIMSVEDGLTYKVSGPMKVTTYKKGKEDGGVTFPTAHPKKGDKIKFGPAAKQMDATITKFGDTSPMASGPGGG